jgi:maltose O-acetyltransferase
MILELARYAYGLVTGRKVLPRRTSVGRNVWVSLNAWIDPLADGLLVSIGDNVTISSGVRILTHDDSSRSRIGVTYVAPVRIGNGAFIGLGAVILPGVRIGDDSIVGAGAVVTEDVPSGKAVAGVPARVLCDSCEIHAFRISDSADKPIFSRSVRLEQDPSFRSVVQEMLESDSTRNIYLIDE